MNINSQILQDMRDDIAEIKQDVKHIYRIINGNGGNGLTVRVDRNTGFRRNAVRALWVLFGTVTGLTASIVLLVIRIFIHQ
ncbi:MAG TPA: hypothetical protein ENL08_03965 [Bacteroidetes bacterium]|nr:hypothetical protein [Bacteroidota bacterium]